MINFGSVTTARAIEMRWHWPPENWCGRLPRWSAGSRPTSSMTSSTFFCCSVLGSDLPDLQALGDDVLDLAPRVQRRDRVLEDHLHARPDLAQVLAGQLREVLAFEVHDARVRARQLHDRLAGRRLAAARLADEAERLARHHVDADVGDRVHVQPGAADGELDDEVLDPQQRLVGGRAGARSRCRPFRPPTVLVTTAPPAPPTGVPAAVSPAARLRASASFPASVPTGKKHRYACPGSSPSLQRRFLGEALRLRVRAPGRELAPGRRAHEVGRAAADRVEAGVARLRELRDRLEQRLGVRVAHLAEQRRASAPSRRTGPRT